MEPSTNTYSKKQQQFLDMVNEGKNVFLSGKAGTGKTFIVKKAMNILQEEGKLVVAIAPTGIAANNLGGQTIHSMFSITPFGVMEYEKCSWLKSEKKKMIGKVKIVIIDEVSMLRPDVMDAIHWTMVKNGIENGLKGKQVIFVGDMKQLPPPIDDNMRSMLWRKYDGDEFTQSKIYKELEPVELELDEVLRQSDEEFIHHLNIVRDGGNSDYFWKFVGKSNDGVILAPHNTTVAEYNRKGLESIQSPEIVFDAIVEGNVKAEEFNVENRIVMKHGAKIMYLANSRENPLVNGTLGTFIVKSTEEFSGPVTNYFIEVKGEEFAINPMKFTKKEYVFNSGLNKLELQEIGAITQVPIRLAWALSVHKSQGLTFDEMILDLTRPCFCKGQLYTALSRVRSPEGLAIVY